MEIYVNETDHNVLITSRSSRNWWHWEGYNQSINQSINQFI